MIYLMHKESLLSDQRNKFYQKFLEEEGGKKDEKTWWIWPNPKNSSDVQVEKDQNKLLKKA